MKSGWSESGGGLFSRETQAYAFRLSRLPRGRKGRQARVQVLLLLMIVLVAGAGILRNREPHAPRSAALSNPLGAAIGADANKSIQVYNIMQNQLATLPLEEYLVGVVAAEMPAAYEPEALKAQAVAARTYVAANLASGGCSRYGKADVCTDHEHCQAWVDDQHMHEKWGSNYQTYLDKVQAAVQATRGEVLYYEDQPILALYHAVSGGMTEDVEHVYTQVLPYLRSVASPGEQDAANYQTLEQFTQAEVAKRLNAALPGANLRAEGVLQQISVVSRFASGRVETVQVGAVEATGRQFRQALGLNSANFTLYAKGDAVVIETLGYGHGVGMSQTGANAMAAQGADYRRILLHYYTGVQIGSIQ